MEMWHNGEQASGVTATALVEEGGECKRSYDI